MKTVSMACSLCARAIKVEGDIARKTVCPKCGGDLHICLNCRFYSETSHNKCLEPRAEYQRTRDKANYCDWFQPRKDKGGGPTEDEKDGARKKLDSLFGGVASTDDEGPKDLNSLFKD